MTAGVITPQPSHSTCRARRPRIVPLTVEQYHRMIEEGILSEDPSVELLNGLLVRKDRSSRKSRREKVSPEHCLLVCKLNRLAKEIDSSRQHLQCQGPLTIPPISEPEPDGAVVRGRAEDYAKAVPTASDALAVFEVADSSLEHDRTTKLRVYAGAGIPQYIIINIPDEQVELHTHPISAQQRYASVALLKTEQKLRLNLGGRKFEIPVRKLLP